MIAEFSPELTANVRFPYPNAAEVLNTRVSTGVYWVRSGMSKTEIPVDTLAKRRPEI